MTMKIVADSSANLLAFHGVPYASVPLKIVAGDKEFVDDASLNTAEMLSFLENYPGKSGTACPSVGEWLEAFGDAQYVFTVAITSNLSGCHNAAVQAKAVYEEQYPERHVCCLDTLSTGPEMVLIVEKLKELMDAGLSFEEIEIRIRNYMTKTHLMFMLESVDNLAKNGRVSPIVAKACGILNIRIVGCASDVGTLQPDHKCRGTKKALETIVKDMVDKGYHGGKVIIDHVYNPDAANALRDKILEQFPEADVRIGLCGGLCCFYAEQGGLLVGYES